jgi:hypothetical protein
MILQSTNKVAKKWDLVNTQLKKFKLAKNINTKWKLELNTMFMLVKQRDNKHVM